MQYCGVLRPAYGVKNDLIAIFYYFREGMYYAGFFFLIVADVGAAPVAIVNDGVIVFRRANVITRSVCMCVCYIMPAETLILRGHERRVPVRYYFNFACKYSELASFLWIGDTASASSYLSFDVNFDDLFVETLSTSSCVFVTRRIIVGITALDLEVINLLCGLPRSARRT